MADPKPDVCRVMAEEIYYSYPHFRTWFPEHKKKEIIGDLTDAIRKHTIVPEMMEFIIKVSDCTEEDIISRRAEIRADARILLAKGRK